MFAVADEIMLNILAMKQNLAAGGFQKADEHLDGGAFA